jgi:tetraacyldisaccharide 4'-kinase
LKAAARRVLVDAWYSGAWWLWLLRPFEWLFRAFAAVRRVAYRCGLISTYRPEVPVVVVGNITVGGTGKTPVVIALVESLREHGITAGVVSRGYGASENAMPHVVGEQSEANDCGDEALLIYRRTACPCVVAASRSAAARVLLEQHEVDLIISDDGLQHYALARDLEIVMYDANSAFGNGLCLPAGPLREPLARLSSVDFVLGRGSDDPVTGVAYQEDKLVNIASHEERPVFTDSIGSSVFAVAGLARPALFLESLGKLGFKVEARLYPDHHPYSAADFSGLQEKPIIMTEKDAVKCRGLVGGDAWYLQVSAILPKPVVQAVVALAGR